MTKVEAIEKLKTFVRDGDTVYTILSSVSRSGMSRRIKCVVGAEDMSIMNITFYVAKALDRTLNEKGLREDGCGMDMGFHLVESLSHVLGIKLNQQWL